MALLVTLELLPDDRPKQAFDEIGRAATAGAPTRRSPLLPHAGRGRRLRPGGDRGAWRPRASRPAAGRARRRCPRRSIGALARAKHAIDPRIEKTAADIVVPFDQLGRLLDFYEAEFERRGLDAAVWGHISDGNLHPNVIPRSLATSNRARPRFWRSAARPCGSAGHRSPNTASGAIRSSSGCCRELYGEVE